MRILKQLIIIISLAFITTITGHTEEENHDTCSCECDFEKYKYEINERRSGDKEKCFSAVGDQCNQNGALRAANPQYNFDNCTVTAYVTPGSIAHDRCCVENPHDGVACSGFGSALASMTPVIRDRYRNNPCWDEWNRAVRDVEDMNRGIETGEWKVFGPYYKDTETCKETCSACLEAIGMRIPEAPEVYSSYDILDNGDCVTTRFSKDNSPHIVIHRNLSITSYIENDVHTIGPNDVQYKFFQEAISCCKILRKRKFKRSLENLKTPILLP